MALLVMVIPELIDREIRNKVRIAGRVFRLTVIPVM